MKTKIMNQLKYIVILFVFSIIVFYFKFNYNIDNIYIHKDGFDIFQRFLIVCNKLNDNNFSLFINTKSLWEFGYINPIFEPEILIYPFAFLTKFGLSNILCFKIYITAIFFLMSLSIFVILTKYLEKNKNKNYIMCTIFSLLYTYNFYQLNLLESGQISILTSMIFIPLVLFGIYSLIENKDNYLFITIGFTGLFFSNLIVAILLLILSLFIYLLNLNVIKKDSYSFCGFLKGLIIAIFISAVQIFPLIEIMMSDTFNFQLIELSAEKFNNLTRYIIEIPPYVIIILILLFILISDKIIIEIKYLFLSLILFSLTTTIFDWTIFKDNLNNLFAIIKTPNMFLIFIPSLLLIAFSTIILKSTKNKFVKIIKIIEYVAISIFCFLNIIFFTENTTQYKDLYNEDKILFDSQNYYNEYLFLPSDININDLKNYKTLHEINLDKNIYKININGKSDYVEFPIIYYKGYSAIYRENKLEIRKSENGLVEVFVPNGQQTITVEYTGTQIQKISVFISFISIGLLIILLLSNRFSKSKTNISKSATKFLNLSDE